jgi:hypothetical protein
MKIFNIINLNFIPFTITQYKYGMFTVNRGGFAQGGVK